MIKKKLIRNDDFKTQYDEWVQSTDLSSLLREIRTDFESNFFGYSTDSLELIKSPTYHMLVYKKTSSLQEIQFLLDYWKSKLLAQGYTLYMSDLRTEMQDGGEKEHIERHYLKPDIYDAMLNGESVDRRFGNIILELYKTDHSFLHLKLTQNFYHERETKLPKGLDALMESLLK